jgi:hypothetical protein
MTWIVTDDTCGHTVIVAAARHHAVDHVRLATTAGHPASLRPTPARLNGAAAAHYPAASCQGCTDRLIATLNLMLRERVGRAAIERGADPFRYVEVFENLRRFRVDLDPATCADAAIAIAHRSLPAGPVGAWTAEKLDPSDPLLQQPSSGTS